MLATFSKIRKPVVASMFAGASLWAVSLSNVGVCQTKQQTETGTNAAAATEGKQETNSAVDRAALAARLALLGEKQQQPFLLLAAAQLLGELQESAKDASGVEKKAETADESNAKRNTLNYRDLLSQAEEMAEKQGDAGKLILEQIAALRTKGIVYSQGHNNSSQTISGVTFKIMDRDRIDPGKSWIYRNMTFEAQKPAIVMVIGDGDGDLDMFVYDSNSGGLIGSDEESDSTPLVQWRPRYEGSFEIVVRNVGDTYENFVLLCNW